MERKRRISIRDRLLKIGSDKGLREELGKGDAYGVIKDVNMYSSPFPLWCDI